MYASRHPIKKCSYCKLHSARHLTDRKSTRLISSHLVISYAVFCLKKKKTDDDDHQVHLSRSLEHVLLPPYPDLADGLDYLEVVTAAHNHHHQLRELRRRLGALRDERYHLPTRYPIQVVHFVDDDRVRGEGEEDDYLRVFRCHKQDDRVYIFDELDKLLLPLDNPGAGAVDDFE